MLSQTAGPASSLTDTGLILEIDGAAVSFPYIWLRDNCPSAFHPQTHERVGDLMAFDPDCKPTEVRVVADHLEIVWADDGHVSRFPLAWLAARRPGRPRPDPAEIAPIPWRGDKPIGSISRFPAEVLLRDDGALCDWMTQTAAHGLSIVDGLGDDIEAGMDVARRIGFLRRTNFGTTFEVVNRPDPNNLAYTSVALPLHTDLPNQEFPPGFQFLHCVANEAKGGESVFADGFALAADLKATDEAAFRLLSTVPIPFRFHDDDTDIRVRAPVIALNAEGAVTELRYNAHIADQFDMDAGILPAYYRAYRTLMAMTRSPAYRITFKLNGGEMVVFDNRRVLHGRARFDPNTGFRHLHGCYVDRGEFNSRLRVLNRP